MALTKQKLSGSTDGKNIAVSATTSGGANTVHLAHATAIDEIWLWAVNTDSVERKLTIQWGATGAGDQLEIKIPPECGLVTVIPGYLLTNALTVTAFADAASVINLNGFVNRIS